MRANYFALGLYILQQCWLFSFFYYYYYVFELRLRPLQNRRLLSAEDCYLWTSVVRVVATKIVKLTLIVSFSYFVCVFLCREFPSVYWCWRKFWSRASKCTFQATSGITVQTGCPLPALICIVQSSIHPDIHKCREFRVVPLQFGGGFGGGMVMISFFFFFPPPLSGSKRFWAAMLKSITRMTCFKGSHWLGLLYGCGKIEKLSQKVSQWVWKLSQRVSQALFPALF